MSQMSACQVIPLPYRCRSMHHRLSPSIHLPELDLLRRCSYRRVSACQVIPMPYRRRSVQYRLAPSINLPDLDLLSGRTCRRCQPVRLSHCNIVADVMSHSATLISIGLSE